MDSIFSLFTSLTNIIKTLAQSQYQVSKIRQAAKDTKYALVNAQIVFEQKEFSGGDIFNSRESINRITKEKNWRTGMLDGLQEISGAMPYIEHSIDYMQQKLLEAQRFSVVCENIEKPLHAMVLKSNANNNWSGIDSVQLNAFNSSMSKLYVMIVSAASSSGELVKDTASMIEILNAVSEKIKELKKKFPESSKYSNYIDAVIVQGKNLNVLAKENYSLISSIKSAPLLHPKVLSLPSEKSLKFGVGLQGALNQMKSLAQLKQKQIIHHRD